MEIARVENFAKCCPKMLSVVSSMVPEGTEMGQKFPVWKKCDSVTSCTQYKIKPKPQIP